MAKPSRTPSSSTFNVRNRRPPYKRVAHKIDGPDRIGLWQHDERLAQRTAAASSSVAAGAAGGGNTPATPFLIPGMPIEPEPIATLPEAPATLRGHERGERRDHRAHRVGPNPRGADSTSPGSIPPRGRPAEPEGRAP